MEENWGFTGHGTHEASERATIVSGFDSKEAAIAHARKKSLVQRTIDVGLVFRDADGKTRFEVAETVTVGGEV